MTGVRGKYVIVLERVSYIYYLVQFRKRDKKVSKILMNSGSEVNAMTIAYAKELGLQI